MSQSNSNPDSAFERLALKWEEENREMGPWAAQQPDVHARRMKEFWALWNERAEPEEDASEMEF